ncbi:cytochrome P450 [Sporichthya brevicatena]|uniref:Cytochrome P450 n=1 Tax=Sporichthya brevicatena TaxID=171442 RepID=A0ABN1GD18_9ACTN
MAAPTCPYAPTDFGRLYELEPELVRCPFPLYDVLRDREPVWFDARLDAYVVTRYADVMEILRDPLTFSSAMASGPTSITGLAQRIVDDPARPERLRNQAARRLRMAETPVLLLADPPQHKRQRALVASAFSPRRIAALEPEVRELAATMIDGFAARGEVELVREFALPLPMTVIATMLGVPPSDLADFKRWANAFTAGVGSADKPAAEVAQMFADIDAFYDYFTEQIARRRARGQDDLLTDLVHARMDGVEPLTDDEILLMLAQFLVGGHETTTLMITSMMHRFATEPYLAARVRREPELLPALLEEMLRLEAPVQGMFRSATRATRIGDVDVPAGALLWLVFGSANRDPEAFPDPDFLSSEARRTPHLTFGRFEHFCLGSSVARLELRVAGELLLDRLREIRLACEPHELERHRSFVLHGYPELPLRFTAAP